MIKLNYENTNIIPEALDTSFGFGLDKAEKAGVIRVDEIVIGFYNLCVDEPVIELTELEILIKFQNKGYGRAFIEELFVKYPECNKITGQATIESEGFYSTIGAEMEEMHGCVGAFFTIEKTKLLSN